MSATPATTQPFFARPTHAAFRVRHLTAAERSALLVITPPMARGAKLVWEPALNRWYADGHGSLTNKRVLSLIRKHALTRHPDGYCTLPGALRAAAEAPCS